MKNIIVSLGLLLLSTMTLTAQQKKAEDIKAIKSLCGCFEIDFDYTETFAPDTNYVKHDDYHATAGAEYAFIVEETEDFISIQHLLIVGGGHIVKHWREDWIYENTDFYEFDKELNWKFTSKKAREVKGTWTQKVYQVDDSPRYEGYATWIHEDGKHTWSSITDGPLPRREYSHRSDYNVLRRGNRIALTSTGWLHEQDNVKIIRTENGDEELVQEKGFNNYKIQEEGKCQAAIDWWKKNEAYWALVRAEWKTLFELKQDISIAQKVDDKMLWEALFGLGTEVAEKTPIDNAEAVKDINAIIQKYALTKS